MKKPASIVISRTEVRQNRRLERVEFVLNFQLIRPVERGLSLVKTAKKRKLFPGKFLFILGNNPPDPPVYTSKYEMYLEVTK